MAPDGNIYTAGESISDFSLDPANSAIFIHEMMHVVQYQHGANVVLSGMILHSTSMNSSLYDPYDYSSQMRSPADFQNLNIEQQGIFFEDLFRFQNNMDMYHGNLPMWRR